MLAGMLYLLASDMDDDSTSLGVKGTASTQVQPMAKLRSRLDLDVARRDAATLVSSPRAHAKTRSPVGRAAGAFQLHLHLLSPNVCRIARRSFAHSARACLPGRLADVPIGGPWPM